MDAMNLYENQFDSAHNFPTTERKKTLIIASTPRCGSHFLGHALFKTKHFGFPLEYANPANIKKWQTIYNESSFEKLLGKIEQDRTSENGVFSIKTHYSHLSQFHGINGLLKRYIAPHFILLSRSDNLKQAVSLAIARQTGVWISEQIPKNNVPVYDYKEIHYCLKRTILQNAAWKYALTTNNCNFMELDFETTTQDLKQAIVKISEFMSIDLPPESISINPATKEQGNELNRQWLTRFLEEHNKDSELLDIEWELNESKKKRILNTMLGK